MFKRLKQIFCLHKFKYYCYAGGYYNKFYEQHCRTKGQCSKCKYPIKRCIKCGKEIIQ